MRLAEAYAGQVVQNHTNRSFYRFERIEESGRRVRIRPLELFPTGLLVAKSTDTTVESTLGVDVVGMWDDGMVVSGPPSRSEKAYRNELAREEGRLVVLLAEYELLPVDGKGKQSRGSHANKVKSCESRIETLRRGLAFVPDVAQESCAATAEHCGPTFSRRQLVQLPSGQPAVVVTCGSRRTRIRTRIGGSLEERRIPTEVLRPWEHSRVATV